MSAPHPSASSRRRSALAFPVLALTCACWGPGWVTADEVGDPEAIRWNGFLNVVAGRLRYDTETRNGTSPPGYYGYDDTLTFDRQTSAALQAVKPLDDEMSVTAQVFADGRDNNYAANLRWLYLTWQPEEHSRFRIGRINMPYYYYSDFMDVGYAYHWSLLPNDVYLYNATVVGVNYIYSDTWRAWDWSAEVLTGGDRQYLAQYDYDVETKNTRGLVLTGTLEGWLTLRTMWLRQVVSIFNPRVNAEASTTAGFEAAVASGALPSQEVADAVRPLVEPFMTPYLEYALDLSDVDYTYKEVAVRAEKDRWMAMAEWVDIRSNTYLQTTEQAWYVTGGVRTGEWLWHLTYSEFHRPLVEKAVDDFLLPRPEGFVPAEQGLWFARQIAGSVAIARQGHWYTQIAGAAWHVTASTVLKAEVTRFYNSPDFPQETSGTGRNYLFNVGMSTTF